MKVHIYHNSKINFMDLVVSIYHDGQIGRTGLAGKMRQKPFFCLTFGKGLPQPLAPSADENLLQ